MAKRKYSEVEMIGGLKQMKAGRSVATESVLHNATTVPRFSCVANYRRPANRTLLVLICRLV
jgi:hypothetical protein